AGHGPPSAPRARAISWPARTPPADASVQGNRRHPTPRRPNAKRQAHHAPPSRPRIFPPAYLQAVLRRLAAWLRICGLASGYFDLMRPSVVQPSDFWPMPMKDWASLSIASEARVDLGYFL